MTVSREDVGLTRECTVSNRLAIVASVVDIEARLVQTWFWTAAVLFRLVSLPGARHESTAPVRPGLAAPSRRTTHIAIAITVASTRRPSAVAPRGTLAATRVTKVAPPLIAAGVALPPGPALVARAVAVGVLFLLLYCVCHHAPLSLQPLRRLKSPAANLRRPGTGVAVMAGVLPAAPRARHWHLCADGELRRARRIRPSGPGEHALHLVASEQIVHDALRLTSTAAAMPTMPCSTACTRYCERALSCAMRCVADPMSAPGAGGSPPTR